MHETAEVTAQRLARGHFKPEIILAPNVMGEEIKSLVNKAGFLTKLDWSDIYPFWLVAIAENKIVGCLQVCPGKPVGRLEMLAVDQEYTHQKKAKVVSMLLTVGVRTLKAHGAQMVTGHVGFEDKGYKRMLKKRGCEVISSGNMMAMVI